jgi:outer membrane receptor protein involved in Fe transport
MKRSQFLTAIVLVAALFTLATGAHAQAVLGTIQGYVTDADGGALPGVPVTVDNLATGADRTVFTSDSGFYAARALDPGTYDVTAAMDGMRDAVAEGVRLLVGQTVDVNLKMVLDTVAEAITVTSSGIIEASRSAAASYVDAEEIENYPILGRDFKQFALLTPTVQNDSVRGFVTMSGQRGIYTGLNIDGTSGKNAFFGYGTGGEATENDGVVVAQESVQEFQVVTSGFSPEIGASGGGYINVITKSGTNSFKGSAFYLFTDDSLKADIPASPLDVSRGRPASTPVDEFERENLGFSLGGPIKKDRVHFFFTYDGTTRDEPFQEDLRTRGVYDAIQLLGQTNPDILALVDGYTPNNDGVAAPDPANGRTATGLFLRSVDNTILFGKADFQINDSNSATFRFNYTDYERTSSFKDEESLKTEETNTLVGSLVSLIGNSAVNEFRISTAYDDLGRASQRVGEPIEAQIRFFNGSDPDEFNAFDSLGKFDFLPILADTDTLAFYDGFSYLLGDHDLKFGVDYTDDNMKQLFAGSLDGRYDYATMTDLLNNNALQVRIYFGNVNFPNYDEKQEQLSVFAQDSFRPNPNLTVNYGIRWQGTYSPKNLEHALPVGESIPDDTDNFDPRVGFTYTPGGDPTQVIRGGIGLFHARTPTLLYASQIQENGIFPNYGRITVRPGETGFVPFGTPIDNFNPPRETIPSTSYFDPGFEDAEIFRVNLGYEKQVSDAWTAGVDLVYAEGSKLQRNDDLNREVEGVDEFGRVLFADDRPNPNFNTIFVRQSVGNSEYTAVTLKARRRHTGRYSLQAHYTWSEDKDDDSNERSATSVTITNPLDLGYDWGLSDRDVEQRFVVSGLVELPAGFKLSGGAEYRSGTPWTVVDPASNYHNYPGFNGPAARGIFNGALAPRNGERNESITAVNLRASKDFTFADRYGVELFIEAFNLFDENSFAVVSSQAEPDNAEFGIADSLVTEQRQYQWGVRLTLD